MLAHPMASSAIVGDALGRQTLCERHDLRAPPALYLLYGILRC